MVKQSIDICEKKGVLGSGYIPKTYQTTCIANSKGLFAYYQSRGSRLHPHVPDAGRRRLRLGGHHRRQGHQPHRRRAAHRDRRRQGGQEPEAARDRAGPLHGDPRAARRRAVPVADDGLFNARTAEGPVGSYFSGKQPGTTKVGEKLFSDRVTLKSDIGNPILRQTPIGTDGLAAKPVTWVEKGVLKNLYYDRRLGEAPEEGRRRRRTRT